MVQDNSNLLDLAQARHSVRSFLPRPVEEDTLRYILEVARLAPSAVNYQPWQLYVVREPQFLASLQQVYHREWLASAPCVVVICGNHNESWHRASDGKDHCDIDVAIVTEHIALAVAEQGLGCCWICNFDVAACTSLLQLPEGVEPMVLMPIGYPANDNCPPKSRKPLEEIVQWR